MKFSLFSILAILSVTATAATSGQHAPSNAHQIKRQEATRPPVGLPAMADANGNVIPYDRNAVVSQKAKRAQMLKAKRHEEAVKRRSAKAMARKRTASVKTTPTKRAASKTGTNKRAAGKTVGKTVKRAGGAKKAVKGKKRGDSRH